MKTAVDVRIRVATFADSEAICQVHKRNAMGDLDPVAWRNRREAYPFAAEFRDIPVGWVLETDTGLVVGVLENVHTLYELGGQRLKGVVASGWAVDAEYRGKALNLMTTFFRQKGVDLWLNVSASPATAQVLTALRIPRIPIPDYGTPCFWAVRRRAFARAALIRKSIAGAALLAWPAGLALLARDVYRRSGRGRLTRPVGRLAKFDSRFDELWHNISSGSKRLRAVRTAAVLDWRFGDEFRAGKAVIIGAERGEKLQGYAILTRREGSELGMNLYEVADLQAADDDPATIRDLLLGSIEVSREDHVDALKFMSGTPVKRAPADALQPYTYRMPFWQQYFKAATPSLDAELSTADAWDFSRFDSF